MEKNPRLKLVDENTIPGKIKKRQGEWLKILKSIPSGKAWMVTEEEAGVKATSLKTMINRFVTDGDLPKSYKAIQRTEHGKVTVYVVNSAKATSE